MSNEEEIWKVYPDYPFIEASNLGRVRTKDRVVTYKDGRKHFIKGHVLKQYRDHYGYMYVQFYESSKRVTLKVHRIVATCFIPNPDNLPQVNHIDCNRPNNVASNLEWCTNQYNTAYREKYGKADTLEVSIFNSQVSAGHQLGIDPRRVNDILKGRLKKSHGAWLCRADKNAIEKARIEFSDEVADKVEELTNKRL